VREVVHLRAQFIQFRKARCYVAGEIIGHHSLRVRLADVSAWTVSGVHEERD
jgi:hypothetical protein